MSSEPRVAVWRRIVADPFARCVLVLGGVFGLAFVFLVPPTQGSDEPSHYLRAYTIGGGNVLADEDAGHFGASIDSCVVAYLDGHYERAVRPDPLVPSQFDDVLVPCDGVNRFQVFDNTASYPPVAYLFQLPGVAFGRVLGLSIPVTFYLGRLTGILCYVVAAAVAVWVSPRAKPALMVLAVLPMSLTMAATYNGDGVAMAAALVVAGSYLALRSGDTRRFVLALFVVALTLVCIDKAVYSVMAPLALVIPASALGSPRRPWVVRTCIAVLPVAAAAAWYFSARGATGAIPDGVDVGDQLRYITDGPLRYARLLVSVLLRPGRDTPFVDGFVMVFGWNRSAGAFWRPPLPVVVAGYMLLGHAYVADAARSVNRSVREVAIALAPVALFVAGSLLVMTWFYLTWTPVGGDGISGLQGRYWLPLAVLPAMSASLIGARRDDSTSARWFAVGSLMLLVAVTAESLVIFY